MARYVPALRFGFLTPLYDPVVRLTSREGEFKKRLTGQASVTGGMDVLDLGCGTGTLALMIAERERGAHVVGLDGDPEMLDRARTKAAALGLDVAFDEGMSFELPYEDGSFDRVVTSLFLHHLTGPDKLRTLREVRRVLRPGGELHVGDWGRPRGLLMKPGAEVIRRLDGDDVTRDNLAGRLPALFRQAGLVRVSERGGLSTPLGTLAFYSAQS
jgi:ubiquinone/menaquinone biosynthesis C-methylase UbiE